nr:Gag-Pol polyprotein [Tanacetum cinerariifolium]
MTTLAEDIIVAGAENHPRMIEKSIYDSWASLMRLFIKGKKHGRIMFYSIDTGPLVYPTIEENRQTRLKKYSKLTKEQKLQDDCEVQATNIILHGLPPDVYVLNTMTTLAEDIIVAGAENHPRMIEKSIYDSWASLMRLFIKGKKHGRIMFYSIDTGPLVYPTIEENRQTRLKKYSKLTKEQKLQDDCEVQATNIILHGLPPDVHIRITYVDPVSLGEWHMARQCTQPKRPINSAWFKEKLMLVEAQEAGQILDEEQLAFIADPKIEEYPDVQEMSYSEQTHIVDLPDNKIHNDSNNIPYSQYLQETENAGIQDTNSLTPSDLLVLSLVEQMTDHVANLDKENQTNKMVNESLTAELERYKERVVIFEQRQNVDLNKREKLIDSQMDDLIRNRIAKLEAFQQDIDTLKETLSNNVRKKEFLSTTLNVFKIESTEEESKYIDKEIVLEKQNKELENIICKLYRSTQAMHMLTKPQVFYDDTHKQALGYQNSFHLKKAQRIKPTLYDGSFIVKKHDVIGVIDDEEALILEEKELIKDA